MSGFVMTDVARRQFVEIDEWWCAHRQKTDLFIDEFEAAMGRLVLAPESGAIDDECGVPGVRTILLPRSRYLVFYRIADDRVRVTAIWHARRGTRPDRDDLARERETEYGDDLTPFEDMDPDERAELEAALDESLEQFARGESIPIEEALRRLRDPD